MWLDRLTSQASSGSSTPQAASRPYSPVPRRTSSTLSPYTTSQRPGISPRGSTLSLVSNDSSASLLGSARRPNGLALRQASTSDHRLDSLQVLDKLLSFDNGSSSQRSAHEDFISENDLKLEFDFGNLTLKQLVNTKQPDEDLDTSWHSSPAQDYEEQRRKFQDLHKSIAACDEILGSVETNLTNFRNDLASVSADIESLQDRSLALNRRLENREAVEKALAPYVEELSLSPDTIHKICNGHVDESWIKLLSEVDKRDAAHKRNTSSSQPSKASEDLGPLLGKLISKAIERIRDFLVAQIKALRSPNINAQIIQQHNFIKFKDLFLFLHRHHSKLADEISLAYMNTMRWYYNNQFSRYEKALGKIKLHSLDKTDALGQEDTGRKTSVLLAARVSVPAHDTFSLGRRIDVLTTRNLSALSSHIAEEDQSTHYLEVPFRNFNLALVDNATAEYSFMATFFSPALSFSQISKNFNYVFEPTFELGQHLSKTLIVETYDALGLFICIRLNQHFAFELQRRKVPSVESYVNGTNMLLWPRLQLIMDRHCESVRQLTNSLPSKPSRSASDSSKMSTAPHLVTQRFGQLLQGFLALSTDAGDDEPVVSSMKRLRSEVEAFLSKQSRAEGGDQRKSRRFLYNNYSLVMTIIGDIRGKLAIEQREHLEKLIAAYEEET